MTELLERRKGPFAVTAAIMLFACILVVQLPDAFVRHLYRTRPLTTPQAGWAYRLLAIAAVAQAAYGGFVLLHSDRVKRLRAQTAELGEMTNVSVASSVARHAAFMTGLTLVYGLAALAVTGERGGFWLFPVLALLQGAWYYRRVGEISHWMSFQPRTSISTSPEDPSEPETTNYCPPIARALRPNGTSESSQTRTDA